MSLGSRAFIAVLVGVALGLTLTTAGRVMAPESPVNAARDARLLHEVLERVQREYVDPIDDERLMEAAVRGMVADLDAHSQFLDADEFEDIRVGATGRYSGVGLEVTLQGRDVVVIAPFADSPAARAGIQPGDVIIAINERPVSGTELFETVQRMRGPAGSPVHLTVMRPEVTAPLEFRVERESLQIASVAGSLLAPGIGYASVSQFHEATAQELSRLLRNLERENLTPLAGLILDLRNNPGGLLDAAADVADLFLDGGVIVSARGRTEDAAFELRAQRGSLVSETEILVLVNGASASAAEIVAGALQDHERARLLGTSTFGKGLVQTVMPLRDGQAIKLTTSRYYTPDGHYIQDRGITPDIVVRNSDADDDRQLARALATLGHRRLVQHTAL
ncbi:MAG: S41 family peptidase [Pseudomonadota bacterium]